MNAAIWVTASPHEWEWTKSDQVAMARFCCWANLTIEQQAATIAGLRARLKERCIVKLTFGSLFAGIGGFDLGFERAGMECKWQVEINPFCQKVLAKHWPHVRRHNDVRTFPPKCKPCTEFFAQFRCNAPGECDCPPCQGTCECDREWTVDVICGGFPCQDISVAGKGAGLAGERSGLFYEYMRIVSVLRPRFVVVENVAALVSRGLDTVLGCFHEIGFDAEWSTVSACALGAPHTRDRLFIIAYRHEVGRRSPGFCDERGDVVCSRLNAWKAAPRGKWRDVECWAVQAMETGNGIVPASERSGMVDGVPDRLDRTGACGNSVVPQVAEWIGRNIVLAAGETP